MLERTDHQLVDLLSTRMRLSRFVEECKRDKGESIVHKEREDDRLTKVDQWAKENKINPHFARAVLYFIIDESCKVQLMQLQGEHGELISHLNEDDYYAALKASLLALTSVIAIDYDKEYIKPFSATHAYLRYEKRVMKELFATLPRCELAIDLGCATGHKALQLLNPAYGGFAQVIGYDSSLAMIKQANMNRANKGISSDVAKFEEHDVELGLPISNGSVSFAVMNLGTASDIRNIRGLLHELDRVLIPGGKALLSFYNSEALLYQIGFLPWSVSLAAEIDMKKHCLNVHYNGQEYSVYAHAYTFEEVCGMLPPGIKIETSSTYPTLCSVMPSTVLGNTGIMDRLEEVDRAIAHLKSGAYILVILYKD